MELNGEERTDTLVPPTRTSHNQMVDVFRETTTDRRNIMVKRSLKEETFLLSETFELEARHRRNTYSNITSTDAVRYPTGKGQFGILLWSVVLPLFSMTILRWIMKNGRRCCTYDEEVILDDFVHCEFKADGSEEEEREGQEDIELQSVVMDKLSEKMNQSDPVKRTIIDSSVEEEDDVDHPPDTSFSWMASAGNSNYLYMDDCS